MAKLTGVQGECSAAVAAVAAVAASSRSSRGCRSGCRKCKTGRLLAMGRIRKLQPSLTIHPSTALLVSSSPAVSLLFWFDWWILNHNNLTARLCVSLHFSPTGGTLQVATQTMSAGSLCLPVHRLLLSVSHQAAADLLTSASYRIAFGSYCCLSRPSQEGGP